LCRPVPEDDEFTVWKQIYVWPDGSDALLMLNLNVEEATLVMRWSGSYVHPQLGKCDPCFELCTTINGSRCALWGDTFDTPSFPKHLESMLRGLFLDLGVQTDLVDLTIYTRGQISVKGVFVFPGPEEVEVMRILDEPLPIWWPFMDLLEWIRSRP
jgi:hypothetical protein